MTMATAIGAVSSEAAEWYAIDWQAIQRNVRRLQVRIAQATKVGRWGKVRALQRLLTHSYGGKVLAVRRVTENTGKKTPGVDQEVWHTREEDAGSTGSETQGLSISASTTCLYSKIGRQNDASTRNPHHEGPSDASTAFACSRPRGGNHS
jgi:N-terminal domain of reverse transcriptase